jgi:hypothetical protein
MNHYVIKLLDVVDSLFLQYEIVVITIDENQQAPLDDPLHIPIGPITRARSKKIKEALNGLIQEICGDSKMGHSKLGPKEDEGVVNLIQAIDGRNFLSNVVD